MPCNRGWPGGRPRRIARASSRRRQGWVGGGGVGGGVVLGQFVARRPDFDERFDRSNLGPGGTPRRRRWRSKFVLSECERHGWKLQCVESYPGPKRPERPRFDRFNFELCSKPDIWDGETSVEHRWIGAQAQVPPCPSPSLIDQMAKPLLAYPSCPSAPPTPPSPAASS